MPFRLTSTLFPPHQHRCWVLVAAAPLETTCWKSLVRILTQLLFAFAVKALFLTWANLFYVERDVAVGRDHPKLADFVAETIVQMLLEDDPTFGFEAVLEDMKGQKESCHTNNFSFFVFYGSYDKDSLRAFKFAP